MVRKQKKLSSTVLGSLFKVDLILSILNAAHTEAKGNVLGCSGNAGSRAAGEETEEMEDSRDPDTEKKRSRGLQSSASPELEPVIVPRPPDTSVDCPICQASFPVDEIELHAAYCDGEVAVVGERRPDGDCIQGDGEDDGNCNSGNETN